ncbi:hypothetical protein LPJ70_001705, partial [Coemansia sp. RSA 2708]
MLPLFRTSVASKFAARCFATRSVYVGNTPPTFSADKLRELFGEFGNISIVRMNVSRNNLYHYAHIYYSAGEIPEAGDGPTPSVDIDPTPEESDIVNTAANRAVAERNGHAIDGYTLNVGLGRFNNSVKSQGGEAGQSSNNALNNA